MRRLLREAHPLILLEVHGAQAAQTVWNELKVLDYHILHLATNYPIVHIVDELNWKAYVICK
jgi:hypothetical protein